MVSRFGCLKESTVQVDQERREGHIIHLLAHRDAIHVYFKACFQALCAPFAHRIDLLLLKDINNNYKVHNSAISDNAMTTFMGHLWYLS